MKPSIALRLIAMATAFAVTFVLFDAVASLAEPAWSRADLQLARVQPGATR